MFTFPAAFLYRLVASWMRSRTSKSPFPHGTTTRTFPKQTVTFILILASLSVTPVNVLLRNQFECSFLLFIFSLNLCFYLNHWFTFISSLPAKEIIEFLLKLVWFAFFRHQNSCILYLSSIFHSLILNRCHIVAKRWFLIVFWIYHVP